MLEVNKTAGLAQEIECKDIISPLETAPIMDANTLALIQNLALRQGIETGLIAGHILPQGLRITSLKVSWHGRYYPLADIRSMNEAQKRELFIDLKNHAAKFIKSSRLDKDNKICVLACLPPWPLRPAAKRQIAILEYLFENGSLPLNSLLKKLGSNSRQALGKLVEAGLVKLEEESGTEEDDKLFAPAPPQFNLTKEQTQAVKALELALAEDLPQNRLLYGITGSGKTAIYIELVKKCLSLGKSVYMLAPEVALAHKLRRDFTSAIPDWPICFYHGYQTSSQREQIWQQITTNKKPTLLIGARSAIFLPLFNPGCVILDEEHDSSFKQDEVFPYHAKELAWFRMRQTKGLLLLGSATPDIKTFYASETGSLPTIHLAKRISGNSLPEVNLADISSYSSIGANSGSSGILAKESEDALRDCLKKGEQAIILMNRRGYAPMIYCLDCSKTLTCPNCAIGLAYHKARHKLVCHFCGFTRDWPSPCPDCGKNNFLPIGEGTERIAERLEVIAGQAVLRLDRDSSRKPGSMEEILTAFAAQKSPFLTGTQMLSKGHHFPNVTLVIAADGDIGLNLPDYRAAERTFQLLVQAAGRAGRGSRQGRIIIQTRNPSHYNWEYIRSYDYEGFYRDELARRKKRLYPPFIRLGLLRMSFPGTETRGSQAIAEIGNFLKKAGPPMGVRVLGPAPAPIPLLKGRLRYHCLLKAQEWSNIRTLYFSILKLEAAKHLHLFLDLDPVNML